MVQEIFITTRPLARREILKDSAFPGRFASIPFSVQLTLTAPSSSASWALSVPDAAVVLTGEGVCTGGAGVGFVGAGVFAEVIVVGAIGAGGGAGGIAAVGTAWTPLA